MFEGCSWHELHWGHKQPEAIFIRSAADRAFIYPFLHSVTGTACLVCGVCVCVCVCVGVCLNLCVCVFVWGACGDINKAEKRAIIYYHNISQHIYSCKPCLAERLYDESLMLRGFERWRTAKIHNLASSSFTAEPQRLSKPRHFIVLIVHCSNDRTMRNSCQFPVGPINNVYHTALLSAVCSVHLHGPSWLPVVNYFSIMTVAKHIITAVKESGFFHFFCITPHVASTPADSVA